MFVQNFWLTQNDCRYDLFADLRLRSFEPNVNLCYAVIAEMKLAVMLDMCMTKLMNS